MKDALAQREVSDHQLLALVTLLALAVLPHAANLSAWIIGFFGLSVAWRLAAMQQPRLLPPGWSMPLLMLAGIAVVLVNAGLGDGRLAGTALLVVMLGLKLLELRSRRDVFVCVFLGFFVVMTQFLYNKDLALALYLLVPTALLVALLIALNRVHPHLRSTLTASAWLLLAALPVAVTLFVLFPRLDAPLWAVQIATGKAATGISDKMRMGSIGKLSQSRAVAFHVRFQGKTPPPQQRYWRGMVLSNFDGTTWSAAHSPAPARNLEIDPDSRFDYQLIMEPTGNAWLFPLAMPGGDNPQTYFNFDYQLISRNDLNSRTTLEVSAYTQYRALGFGQRQRIIDLALPETVGVRVTTLAAQWRAAHPHDDAAVVDEALRYFREQPFVYTLSPGRTVGDPDPVEHFLFESRRGFCEHFAGSFTLLMRVAGIPARVVAGYQGGEYNPHSGHWTVRQSDAHAWSEVWLGKQRGWVRVDPTAAVAPERIEHSIDTALTEASGKVVFDGDSISAWRWLSREAGWLVDAADIGWHRWVLGFTDRQTSLLDAFGLRGRDAWKQGLGIVLALATGTALVMLPGLLAARRRHDPAFRAWQRLLQRLGRGGLSIPAWAGPLQVLGLATRRWPAQHALLERLVRLYIDMRYAEKPQPHWRRQFRRGLRELRLR